MNNLLSKSCTKGTLRQTLWLLAMALSTSTGIVVLAWRRPALPWRLLAVIVPVALGLVYARQVVRDLKNLDELQVRMQLEGAATACLGVFILSLLYPVLQQAGFVGPMQSYYVVIVLAALLVIGNYNAYRRYR